MIQQRRTLSSPAGSSEPDGLSGDGQLDNLTHALAGAALSKAGLERFTPLATATLVLAANAPDVDVLAYARGPYFALAFRRGVTHGVPALVVLPFVVAGAVLGWDRWVRRRRRPDAPPARPAAVLGLAFLGLLTHPTLDWMNDYGMRWWLPFDGRWSYGDALFIVDPWLLLLLGMAVWAGRARRRRTGLSRGATALAALYVLAMVGRAQLARADAAEAALAAGAAGVETAMVSPLPVDPLGGRVIVRTGAGDLLGTHRWTRTPRVALEPGAVPVQEGGPGLDPAALDAAVRAAMEDPEVRRFLIWSRLPRFRVRAEGVAWVVSVSDARYEGRNVGSLGGLEVRVRRPDGPGPDG